MSSQLKANMTEKQILELQITELTKKLELLKKINAEEEEKLKQSKLSVDVSKKPEIFDTEEDFDDRISKITSDSRIILNKNDKVKVFKKIIKKLSDRKNFNCCISMIGSNNNEIIEIDSKPKEPKSLKTESESESKKSDSKSKSKEPKSLKTESESKKSDSKSKPKEPKSLKTESESKKSDSKSKSKELKDNSQMSIQQLKKIAKDFDIKGYTTMSRDELEHSIKIPTINFNAKKLTKWLNSVKDKTVILFGSNGEIGFYVKENTKNILFADRCNSKDKNFNEIHQKRFFNGNEDFIEYDDDKIETIKKILKKCDTLLYVSRNDENGITFNNNILKLSE